MNFTQLKSALSVEESEIEAFKSDNKASKWTYLIAGVHGDEVEGVFVLNKLFEWLQNEYNGNKNFIVVPIVNVDGYRAGTRVNSHGVDLNRNLPSKKWSAEYSEDKYNPGPKPLSEPENQFLEKLFNKFPPKFIISFHSWKPIINYNGDCLEVANFLHDRTGYVVQDDIGYPTPGSLGEYAPENFNSPVITYELPLLEDHEGLNEIWLENEKAIKDLILSELI